MNEGSLEFEIKPYRYSIFNINHLQIFDSKNLINFLQNLLEFFEKFC